MTPTLQTKAKCICLYWLIALLITLPVSGQQTLTKIDGWNAYVHLPDDYSTSGQNYPVIIFIPGIGEVGTDASKLLLYGPSNFIAQGHNMQFVVNGTTEKPIVISIQPTASWPSATSINKKIDSVCLRWRVDINRVYLTGLSMGGCSWDTYVSANMTYANRIAAVVAMSAPPPPVIGDMKFLSLTGGKWWGFEGTTDYRSMDKVRDTMNAAVLGSARYTQYVGGHCCWNTWYNPTWTEAGDNIYTWMLKQRKGTQTANQPPVANAGTDQTITLPLNTVTLTGSASDPDGSISACAWTKVAGPATFTIGSSGSAQTSITNLVQGTYQFELRATDNSGASDLDTVVVSVLPLSGLPGTANAGTDTVIYLNQMRPDTAVLNASASTGATSYLWSKISGPGTQVITNPTTPITNVTGLLEGTYFFKLTTNGAFSDTVVVSVIDYMKKNIRPCRTGTPQAFILPKNDATQLYRPYLTRDNTVPGLMGGDTLYIPGGSYTTGFSIGDIGGGPGCPIIVAPKDQPVVITNNGFFSLADRDTAVMCYVKFDGTLLRSKGYPYGWIVDNSNLPTASVTRIGMVVNWAHHIEISGVSINHAELGMMYKINAKPYSQGQFDKFLLRGVKIHDNYIRRTNAEGMYIGHTGISGVEVGNSTTYGPPPRMDSVEIYNNIVDSTKLDGIQLSNSLKGCKIYNNLVRRYGVANQSSHKSGILSGGNIEAVRIYNNMVVNGTGSSILVFGFGNSQVFHNVSDSVRSGLNTEYGAYLQRNAVYPEIVSNLTPNVTGNILKNAEATPVYTSGNSGTSGGNVTGNYFINNGSNTVSNNSGATVSSNTVIGNFPLFLNGVAPILPGYSINITQADSTRNFNDVGNMVDWIFSRLSAPPPVNQVPVANAGADQTITLPVSTVTLNGSATDPDGTIATYQWTKIAGPTQFTITTSNTAVSTVTGLVQGVYRFELTATDNSGAADKDTVQVTVNAAVNQVPVANAGADQTITLPVSTVTLNGSATDPDGTIATYQWTKIAGPTQFTITTSNAAVTTVTGLVQGVYRFELTATDNSGAADKDTVQVTVNAALNQLPSANAGTDQVITLPVNSVTLNGSGSDPDGSITNYLWSKIAGPAQYTITSPANASTGVTSLVQGVYRFELTVTDNSGATDKDTVQITVNAYVNQAPVANAGVDQSIVLPVSTVTLNGSGSDPDGNISGYQWVKIAGPAQYSITAASSASTGVTSLVQGVYRFELTVTDNSGATDKDTVQVTVNASLNQLPSANAGADQTITLPVNSVTLNGTGSDPDGSIATYQWSKLSGPLQFTITSSSSASTGVTGLVQGVYRFELTVTDNSGGAAKDTVQVTVNSNVNQAPVANAGADISITLPANSVTLNGSGSDPDGSIIAYQWTKISGPVQFTISSPANASTGVTGLVQGVYLFELTVTDNNNVTGSDTVQVVVNAAINLPPTAYAGTDLVINLPVNSATLNGSGSDPDGTIAGYQWTKVAGPSQFNFTAGTSASTGVVNLAEGIYQFELMVTDNNGSSAMDTVQVTVIAYQNLPPVANAGSDISITLPVNSVTLNGTGSDPDGNITGYTWVKIAGPSQYTINSVSSASTGVTNLTAGVYQFELTVTDNSGATDKDTVQVVVNAYVNLLPVADAGTDLNITLPVNSVTLNGTGSDPDGFISGYLWTKIAGPAQFTINVASSSSTGVTNLTEGVYLFELTVTDNNGATDKDTVQVTVNPAPNQPPVASAGPDITLVLPENSLVLSGIGIDPDGSIVSYQWNKISGPAQFVVLAPLSAQTVVNNLVQGVYKFELTVTDNSGDSDKDTVQVTINPFVNLSPVANAGADMTITLPVNSVTMNGTGSDPDGSIATYQWQKIAGPAQYTIVSPANASTGITNLVQGVYLFELTVTDNHGASGKDSIQVTVNSLVNQPPSANAGTDISITLPVNSTTLNGSGSDPDGTIASYSWNKWTGPAQYTINAPANASTGVTGLVQGVYQFILTVTDNNGATATDTIQVTVNAVPNMAPIVNAGTDQLIRLPVNKVTLTGTAIDNDGSIAGFQWRKIAGPAQFIIDSMNNPRSAMKNLLEGEYYFELLVTDNLGATSRDTVKVTVLPELQTSRLSIYPNPAVNEIIIELDAATTQNKTPIRIYDMSGMVVYQNEVMRNLPYMLLRVDVSQFARGTYIVQVGLDINRNGVLKFVKQ